MNFGDKFRKLRLERGLSQAQVCKAAGVNHSYVSAVERGTREPRLDSMAKLAKGLGMPLGEMFGRFDEYG